MGGPGQGCDAAPSSVARPGQALLAGDVERGQRRWWRHVLRGMKLVMVVSWPFCLPLRQQATPWSPPGTSRARGTSRVVSPGTHMTSQRLTLAGADILDSSPHALRSPGLQLRYSRPHSGSQAAAFDCMQPPLSCWASAVQPAPRRFQPHLGGCLPPPPNQLVSAVAPPAPGIKQSAGAGTLHTTAGDTEPPCRTTRAQPVVPRRQLPVRVPRPAQGSTTYLVHATAHRAAQMDPPNAEITGQGATLKKKSWPTNYDCAAGASCRHGTLVTIENQQQVQPRRRKQDASKVHACGACKKKFCSAECVKAHKAIAGPCGAGSRAQVSCSAADRERITAHAHGPRK